MKNKEVELRQKVYAYRWIEQGLHDLQGALHNLGRTAHFTRGALWCFYQAARRLWWARKFK